MTCESLSVGTSGELFAVTTDMSLYVVYVTPICPSELRWVRFQPALVQWQAPAVCTRQCSGGRRGFKSYLTFANKLLLHYPKLKPEMNFISTVDLSLLHLFWSHRFNIVHLERWHGWKPICFKNTLRRPDLEVLLFLTGWMRDTGTVVCRDTLWCSICGTSSDTW